MRDPHVERLRFAIGSEKGSEYDNPKPLAFENALGRFRTEEGALLVEPADHFPDEAAARSVVEPFLRSWEIGADLTGNAGAIRFKFLSAEVIDRNPPPPGTPQQISLAGTVRIGIRGGTATLLITRRSYPPPPADFTASPDVISAYDRWRGYQAGNEPLLSMAYFVLTLADATAQGRRRDAAKLLHVDFEVLRKLGELTARRGDPKTARKAPQDGQFQKLSDTERAWLEEAVQKIIRRLGEKAAGAQLTSLTLKELPTL